MCFVVVPAVVVVLTMLYGVLTMLYGVPTVPLRPLSLLVRLWSLPSCSLSFLRFVTSWFYSVSTRIPTHWVGTVSSPDGKEFTEADEKAITQVTFSHLTLSYPTLPYLVLPHIALPCVTLSSPLIFTINTSLFNQVFFVNFCRFFLPVLSGSPADGFPVSSSCVIGT